MTLFVPILLPGFIAFVVIGIVGVAIALIFILVTLLRELSKGTVTGVRAVAEAEKAEAEKAKAVEEAAEKKA